MRHLAFVGYAMVIACFSMVAWRLPVQILSPSVYQEYLIATNGHWFAYVFIGWFIVGGIKTALMLLGNLKDVPTGIQFLKVMAFVPFAVLIPFKKSWYELPPEEKN